MKLLSITFDDNGRVFSVAMELPPEQVKFLEEHSADLGFRFFEVDGTVTLDSEEARAVSDYVGGLSYVTSPNYEVTSAIYNFFNIVVHTICDYAEEILEEWNEDDEA